MKNLNLKKFFLYLLIASVSVSALLGIGAMIFGNFGELESKILMTTLCVTVTSILGLACGAYLETRRGKFLPMFGIFYAVTSAVLWIIMIWHQRMTDDLFGKLLMSSTLLATGCSHLSLLSIAKLEKKFLWAYYAVHVSIWTLIGILLFTIWTEYDPSNSWLARTLGVLSIIIAALTIVTPVFHWLSRSDFAGKEMTVEAIETKISKLKDELKHLEKQREEMISRKD